MAVRRAKGRGEFEELLRLSQFMKTETGIHTSNTTDHGRIRESDLAASYIGIIVEV